MADLIARPSPLGSLIASAQRLTSRTPLSRSGTGGGWQENAWEMYDLVGEQHFLATTLAGRMGQARFYVGLFPEDTTSAPDPVEDQAIADVLDAVGSSAIARAQMIVRMGVNLFVTGEGWFAGIPRYLLPHSVAPEQDIVDGLDITDLEWRTLSVSEVTSSASGEITLRLGETEADKIRCSPDDVFLIRVWRPHPRRWWEADSPTRASLPILRELVGLTMHVSAQVDSRLAGAGLLIVPQSAQRAVAIAANLEETDETNPIIDALIEAMTTAIKNRDNASAVVPLVLTVPDEAAALFRFMSFATPLDGAAISLREEAIRRLALGQDAPPELLLGTGSMNHWGAWLVQEDVVTTHLEPPLALICDALTTQYLWPVLVQQGMDEEQAQQYVIWYDVSDLVVRPNRSQDAFALHKAGAIDDEALRAATGFDDTDAPTKTELPMEVDLALDLVRTAPALLNGPGLPEVVAQIRAVLKGDIPDEPTNPMAVPAAPAVPEKGTPEEGAPPVIPQTDTNPPSVPPPGSPQPIAASEDLEAWEALGRKVVQRYADREALGEQDFRRYADLDQS